MTITYQTIISEINQIPIAMLQDVYNMVHSFNMKVTQKEQNRNKIMQLAGSWQDMQEEEFDDFMSVVKKERGNMFNREIELWNKQ